MNTQIVLFALVALVANTFACSKTDCALVVARCAVECSCDVPDCECCPECVSCLGDLYDTCCDCFSSDCQHNTMPNTTQLADFLKNEINGMDTGHMLKILGNPKARTSTKHLPFLVPPKQKGTAMSFDLSKPKCTKINDIPGMNATGAPCLNCASCIEHCTDNLYSYACCEGNTCCCYNEPVSCPASGLPCTTNSCH
jgi:hypothetical protein